MKVLIITWLLAMIVLINAYAGLLTAFLSVPKLKPTLDTFEEVVESSNGWRVTIELNSDLSFKFLVSVYNNTLFSDSSVRPINITLLLSLRRMLRLDRLK